MVTKFLYPLEMVGHTSVTSIMFANQDSLLMKIHVFLVQIFCRRAENSSFGHVALEGCVVVIVHLPLILRDAVIVQYHLQHSFRCPRMLINIRQFQF